VQADRDRAEADGGPEGRDPLRAVRREDRDAIAGADAEAFAQRRRDGRHVAQIVGVRDAAAVVGDEILVRAVCGRCLEQRAQRALPLAEVPHRRAEHGAFDDLERRARRGETRFDLGGGGHGAGASAAAGSTTRSGGSGSGSAPRRMRSSITERSKKDGGTRRPKRISPNVTVVVPPPVKSRSRTTVGKGRPSTSVSCSYCCSRIGVPVLSMKRTCTGSAVSGSICVTTRR